MIDQDCPYCGWPDMRGLENCYGCGRQIRPWIGPVLPTRTPSRAWGVPTSRDPAEWYCIHGARRSRAPTCQVCGSTRYAPPIAAAAKVIDIPKEAGSVEDDLKRLEREQAEEARRCRKAAATRNEAIKLGVSWVLLMLVWAIGSIAPEHWRLFVEVGAGAPSGAMTLVNIFRTLTAWWEETPASR